MPFTPTTAKLMRSFAPRTRPADLAVCGSALAGVGTTMVDATAPAVVPAVVMRKSRRDMPGV